MTIQIFGAVLLGIAAIGLFWACCYVKNGSDR